MYLIAYREFDIVVDNYYGNKPRTIRIRHPTTGSRYLDNLFNIDNINSHHVKMGDISFTLTHSYFFVKVKGVKIYDNTHDRISLKNIKKIIKYITSHISADGGIGDLALSRESFLNSEIKYLYPNFSILCKFADENIESRIIVEEFLNENMIKDKFKEIDDRINSITLETNGITVKLKEWKKISFDSSCNINNNFIRCYNEEFDFKLTNIDIDCITLKYLIKMLFRYALTGILPNMITRTYIKSAR